MKSWSHLVCSQSMKAPQTCSAAFAHKQEIGDVLSFLFFGCLLFQTKCTVLQEKNMIEIIRYEKVLYAKLYGKELKIDRCEQHFE